MHDFTTKLTNAPSAYGGAIRKGWIREFWIWPLALLTLGWALALGAYAWSLHDDPNQPPSRHASSDVEESASSVASPIER